MPVKAEPEDGPSTLAEAEAALERARAELLAVAPGGPTPAPAAAPAPSEGEPPAAGVERSRRDAEQGARDAVEERDESVDLQSAPMSKERAATPCETACKAFASLLRARDAVCRLETPRGERCERAEGIVRDAGTRVQSCACPG